MALHFSCLLDSTKDISAQPAMIEKLPGVQSAIAMMRVTMTVHVPRMPVKISGRLDA